MTHKKYTLLWFVIGSLAIGAKAGAADEKDSLIHVSGECLRKVTPDRAAVTVTAEFNDASSQVASKKAMDLYKKIIDRVKKLNLKDQELETSEFSLQEEFTWLNNSRKSKGFKARHGLRVETSEMGRLGEVLNLAAEMNIRNVSGLETFVARETLKTEQEACLETAFQNAKSKAERISKAAGVRLGSAVRITESEGADHFNYQNFEGAADRMMGVGGKAADDSPPPPIEARRQTISVRVGASFKIN